MTKPRELAERCEDLFMAAALRSESDAPYGPEVWEGVLKTLETAPTLEAIHAALLFRDRLISDEGLHTVGGFMDALSALTETGGGRSV